MIEAKVIADSIANGIRLTTMELCYPRFIHSEFMTHRMFSRNAASSRAIPVMKMLEQVQQTPAIPIHWGKNQPGMQAREETKYISQALATWRLASDEAVSKVKDLDYYEVHKQVANRLLEPFQWIRVIVTSTEWDNFFKLRLHPDAQPEIKQLAVLMKEAMDNSTPLFLSVGEWHLPYVDEDEIIRGNGGQVKLQPELIKCSVARCARVSYLNHDNSTPNIEKDLLLADKLLEAGHFSPFEHQATPISDNVYSDRFEFDCGWIKGITHIDRNNNYWSGNFRGFLQYRQLLQGN